MQPSVRASRTGGARGPDVTGRHRWTRCREDLARCARSMRPGCHLACALPRRNALAHRLSPLSSAFRFSTSWRCAWRSLQPALGGGVTRLLARRGAARSRPVPWPDARPPWEACRREPARLARSRTPRSRTPVSSTWARRADRPALGAGDCERLQGCPPGLAWPPRSTWCRRRRSRDQRLGGRRRAGIGDGPCRCRCAVGSSVADGAGCRSGVNSWGRPASPSRARSARRACSRAGRGRTMRCTEEADLGDRLEIPDACRRTGCGRARIQHGRWGVRVAAGGVAVPRGRPPGTRSPRLPPRFST